MRKLLIAGIATVSLGGFGVAMADESRDLPPTAGTRVSGDTIRQELEGMGYRVVRIADRHGAYRTRAIDRETGIALRLTHSTATGELLEARLHERRD